jgi:predicted O-linked N-acetylglucosamine transferase (SPINDLY family)
MGESIAINSGNSDWIACNIDDYINKAVQFASDLKLLTQLRKTLRDRLIKSPLFDTQRFAKNFGDTLWKMWNLNRHGFS